MDAQSALMEAQNAHMEAARRSAREMHEATLERLDRLIDVTVKERTHSVERLGDLERRLLRLEVHVGIPTRE
jgi:hypothetical protein